MMRIERMHEQSYRRERLSAATTRSFLGLRVRPLAPDGAVRSIRSIRLM
jgi:hypothetical protein